MEKNKIQIIGAGLLGTAFAQRLSKKFDVNLVSRNNEEIILLNTHHKSNKFKNFVISESVLASDKISEDCLFTIVCTRSSDVRTLVENNLQKFAALPNLIIACKGMLDVGNELFSSYFETISIYPFFLSGPNFASEIINGLPFACDLAGRDYEMLSRLAKIISDDDILINPTTDYITTQLAGCYKNSLAIYSGYLIGKNLGENYRAQICSEGIRELKEISMIMGGTGESLYSYSGIGDIMLTCFSSNSRNFKYGYDLARGKRSIENSVEGINSTRSLIELCRKKNYNPRILSEINKLLY